MIIAIAKIEKKSKLNDVFGGGFCGGLSVDGNPPATHCWCGWLPDEYNKDWLESQCNDLIGSNDVVFKDVKCPDEALNELGLSRVI